MPLENRKCAKCHINTIEGEDINLRLHRFPLPSGKYGPLRARVWAEFCFPAGDWSTEKSLKSLHQQHLLLCSKHFDDNAYTCSARKRINKFAIPAGTEGILLRLRQEQEGATSNKTVTNIPGPIEDQVMVTVEIQEPVQESTPEDDTRLVVLKVPKPGIIRELNGVKMTPKKRKIYNRCRSYMREILRLRRKIKIKRSS